MAKVWLITGSARGFGRALCEAVLAVGDRVVATARTLDRLADLVQAYGDRVCPVSLDVIDYEAARAAVAAAYKHFGRLDIVVNAAGCGDFGSIEDTPLKDIRALVETNLFGVINVTKAALPFLREQGAGHFIQLATIDGRVGAAGHAAGSAAGSGVAGFSEALALEIGPLGLKVTIVERGGFRGDGDGVAAAHRPVRPAYADTVGAAAPGRDGPYPGDPRKGAQAILALADLPAPPLRLLLGGDAVRRAARADAERAASDERWRALSLSSDFEI